MSTSFRLCSRAPRTASTVGSPAGTTGGAVRGDRGSTSAAAVAFFAGVFTAVFAVALVALVAVFCAGVGLAAVFDTALARAGALPRVVDVLIPRRSAMVRSVYF